MTIISIIKYGAVDPRSAHRLHATVDQLAKKYKVPEKRLWHIKVRALAESSQWPILRNLADSRAKPPIAMKHFALAAIKGQQGQVEIMHYIDRNADHMAYYLKYEHTKHMFVKLFIFALLILANFLNARAS